MTIKAKTVDLPRVFSATKLSVPEDVKLEGRYICWRWPEIGIRGQAKGRVVSSKGLLEQFLKVTTAPRAYRFAKAYGPLGICIHGEPLCHAGMPGGGLLYDPDENDGQKKGVRVVRKPEAQSFYCAPRELADYDGQLTGWFAEQVSWWLKLSAIMRIITDTASRLKDAQRARPEDLSALYRNLGGALNDECPDEEEDPKELGDYAVKGAEGMLSIDGSRAKAWQLVLHQLNNWLQACPLRLYFTFIDATPVDFSMSFIAGDERGCFAALVYELASQVRGDPWHLMVRCSHCEEPFTPRHEPSGNGRMFCKSCRATGWPQRYALRDSYQRHRTEILASRKEARLNSRKERSHKPNR